MPVQYYHCGNCANWLPRDDGVVSCDSYGDCVTGGVVRQSGLYFWSICQRHIMEYVPLPPDNTRVIPPDYRRSSTRRS